MRFRSIWRAIRRGHLKWIADSISGQYGLYRVLNCGRLEPYGISMSAPMSSISSKEIEEKEEVTSIFDLLKKLLLHIVKALKGKE